MNANTIVTARFVPRNGGVAEEDYPKGLILAGSVREHVIHEMMSRLGQSVDDLTSDPTNDNHFYVGPNPRQHYISDRGQLHLETIEFVGDVIG